MSTSTRTRVTCDYPECPAVIEWVVESGLGIQPSRHGWRHAGTYDDLCPMHAREVVGLAAKSKRPTEVEARANGAGRSGTTTGLDHSRIGHDLDIEDYGYCGWCER